MGLVNKVYSKVKTVVSAACGRTVGQNLAPAVVAVNVVPVAPVAAAVNVVPVAPVAAFALMVVGPITLSFLPGPVSLWRDPLISHICDGRARHRTKLHRDY